MDERLTSAHLAIDAAMVMLIWLVQLIIYPAFRAIEPGRFVQWHHSYMRTFSFIVVPPMVTQAALAAYSAIKQPTPAHLLAASAIALAWLTTFTLSVPCHRALQQLGPNARILHNLIATNWIRTLAWSFAFIAARG